MSLWAMGVAFALAGSAGLSSLELLKVRKQTQAAEKLARELMPAIAEAIVAGDGIPADNADAGLPEPEALAAELEAVSTLAIQNGSIVVTFGEESHEVLRGQVMAMSPCVEQAYGAYVNFACGQQFCGQDMRVVPEAPPAFTLTTLDSELLPYACRGNGRQAVAVRDAAANGDTESQVIWGAMLWAGVVIPPDRALAVDYARQAAAQGHAGGMVILATAYGAGESDVIDQDLEMAYVWWHRAREAGYAGTEEPLAALEKKLTPEQLERAQKTAGKPNLDPAGD